MERGKSLKDVKVLVSANVEADTFRIGTHEIWAISHIDKFAHLLLCLSQFFPKLSEQRDEPKKIDFANNNIIFHGKPVSC